MSVHSALGKFINSISESSKLQHSAFAVWKKIILKKVNRILIKSRKFPANPILSDAHNIQDLIAIEGRFVIVPVDKASNNVSFICKSFYKHVLKEGIMKLGNFIPSNYSENTYSELLSLYNIKEMFSNFIQFLYWIPKFHKHLTAARFITSGQHTAPNTLSNVIGCHGNLLK